MPASAAPIHVPACVLWPSRDPDDRHEDHVESRDEPRVSRRGVDQGDLLERRPAEKHESGHQAAAEAGQGQQGRFAARRVVVTQAVPAQERQEHEAAEGEPNAVEAERADRKPSRRAGPRTRSPR